MVRGSISCGVCVLYMVGTMLEQALCYFTRPLNIYLGVDSRACLTLELGKAGDRKLDLSTVRPNRITTNQCLPPAHTADDMPYFKYPPERVPRESRACLVLHPQRPVPGNFRYASGRFSELVKYALNPADEIVMEEIFQAGFESGENCDCCSFFF